MIRKTLAATKAATFCIELPGAEPPHAPTPTGTGFFVSPDGWFVTAGHVVSENGQPRSDIEEGWLRKEGTPFGPEVGAWASLACQWPTLEDLDTQSDIAVLKVDLQKNKAKDWLRDRDGFPFIQVSARPLEEGEPVYAFGYPLSTGEAFEGENLHVAVSQLSPRTTSAVVSSQREFSGPVATANDPVFYVLDKALNYGNSGGPIVATETGNAHAVCTRFQPMCVPQRHLRLPGNESVFVMMPSLYGVVSSLGNRRILEALRHRGVPLANG